MNDESAGRNSGSLAELVREFLTDSDESGRAYLRQAWLSTATEALRDARRQVGLTQEEVADRLGTTQSAVARLENDREGRVTLHKYIDYALACGTVPLDTVLEPIEAVRAYAYHTPDARRTQAEFDAWSCARSVGGAVPSTAVRTPDKDLAAQSGQFSTPAPQSTLSKPAELTMKQGDGHVSRRVHDEGMEYIGRSAA